MAVGSGGVAQRPRGVLNPVRARSTTVRVKRPAPTARAVRKRAETIAENKAVVAELLAASKKGWPGITKAEKSRRELFIKALLEKRVVKSVTSPSRVFKLLLSLEMEGRIPALTTRKLVVAKKKKKAKRKK